MVLLLRPFIIVESEHEINNLHQEKKPKNNEIYKWKILFGDNSSSVVIIRNNQISISRKRVFIFYFFFIFGVIFLKLCNIFARFKKRVC